MNKEKYSIALDYSREPGPRYIWQGTESGEHFRNTILFDLFDKVVSKNTILEINLDRTAGYGPSFLEEAFGGLARERDLGIINKHLSFISTEEPFLIDEINEYMTDATKQTS